MMPGRLQGLHRLLRRRRRDIRQHLRAQGQGHRLHCRRMPGCHARWALHICMLRHCDHRWQAGSRLPCQVSCEMPAWHSSSLHCQSDSTSPEDDHWRRQQRREPFSGSFEPHIRGGLTLQDLCACVQSRRRTPTTSAMCRTTTRTQARPTTISTAPAAGPQWCASLPSTP